MNFMLYILYMSNADAATALRVNSIEQKKHKELKSQSWENRGKMYFNLQVVCFLIIVKVSARHTT